MPVFLMHFGIIASISRNATIAAEVAVYTYVILGNLPHILHNWMGNQGPNQDK